MLRQTGPNHQKIDLFASSLPFFLYIFFHALSSHRFISATGRPQTASISFAAHGLLIKQQQLLISSAFFVIWILSAGSFNFSQNRLWGHLKFEQGPRASRSRHISYLLCWIRLPSYTSLPNRVVNVFSRGIQIWPALFLPISLPRRYWNDRILLMMVLLILLKALSLN